MDVTIQACALWEQHSAPVYKIGARLNVCACENLTLHLSSGYNTLQIIEQCEKAVSKLMAHALVNGNYRHKFEKGDLSRKKLLFLEVIIVHCFYLLDFGGLISFFQAFELLERICDFIGCKISHVAPTETEGSAVDGSPKPLATAATSMPQNSCDYYADRIFTYEYAQHRSFSVLL